MSCLGRVRGAVARRGAGGELLEGGEGLCFGIGGRVWLLDRRRSILGE